MIKRKSETLNERMRRRVQDNPSCSLLDPMVQLEILRKMEALRSLHLGAGEQSVKPFTNHLAARLVTVHQSLIQKGNGDVDLVHFEYSSLVVRTSLRIEDTGEIREVFPPHLNRVPTPLQLFAEEVDYEPGRDILPKVDCNFCTLLFSPDEQTPSESYIAEGIYPISSSGVEVLTQILKKVQLHPWLLDEKEHERAFLEFSESQGDLPARWDQTHRSHAKKKILPNFGGIFEFALRSAIRTMLLISDELFGAYANFPLCSDPANCPPGQRRGKSTPKQFQHLRARALAQLTGGAARKLSSRALTFVPIRMPAPDEAKGSLETIGLVAYYANRPMKMTSAAALAVMEHLIFMTCRQYEGFKLRNQIQDRLNILELQRIFARLMAHEATRPLGIIRDSLDLLDKAMDDSRAALAKFARGEFGALQKKQRLDVYDVLAGLKSLRAAQIDNLNVRYEDEIYSGTYVIADWDAARYALGVLLDNAIVHGNGRVRVWSKKRLEKKGQGGHVVVYIANNGDPMPPRLEEALENGHPPVRPVRVDRFAANQGIGLNLAFEFARLNEWKLMYHRVEDDPRGLRHVFELWFPSAGNG
jgi:signal transduction histidine kinase